MRNFNLLPPELAPKTSYIKLARSLKNFALIGYSFLLVLLIASFASFVLLTKSIDTVRDKEGQLKTSIKALRETEQRLILIQDRLDKAKVILAKENAGNEIAAFNNFILDLPEGISFTGGNISSRSFDVSLVARSSSDLTRLLSYMYATEDFQSITLDAFNYSGEGAYGFDFVIEVE